MISNPECKKIEMFFITANVIIIFFLLYAIAKAIKEINQMAEEQNEIEQICSRCRERVGKTKLKQISPIEVYLLLIADINTLSGKEEYNSFSLQILNELYHTQNRINRFLVSKRNNISTANQSQKQKQL